MSNLRKKRRRKRCIRCGSLDTKKNGPIWCRQKGKAWQYFCNSCQRQWVHHCDAFYRIPGCENIRTSKDKVIKTIALIAVSLPLNQIERLVGIRYETIWKILMVIGDSEEGKEQLTKIIDEKYADIPYFESWIAFWRLAYNRRQRKFLLDQALNMRRRNGFEKQEVLKNVCRILELKGKWSISPHGLIQKEKRQH